MNKKASQLRDAFLFFTVYRKEFTNIVLTFDVKNGEQRKLNTHNMRLYREIEVLEMVGLNGLQEWYNHIATLPIYRRILIKGDKIRLCYYAGMQPIPGTVLKTHIVDKQISYDLELTFPDGSEETTRAYNISAQYVEEVLFGSSFEVKSWV